MRVSLIAALVAASCLFGASASIAQDIGAEISPDDPSLPAEMRLMLSQTEGVGFRLLPDTVALAQGPAAVRQELISVAFEYDVTGTVTEEYHSNLILTGNITIPAGTPVYASIFTTNRPNDPMPTKRMWCAAGYQGPVTRMGQRGVCFAGSDERVVFYPVAQAQDPYAATSMEMNNFHIGPMPHIEPGPLPVELRIYLVVDAVSDTQIRLHEERGEQSRRSYMRSLTVDLKDGVGALRWCGGQFALRADGEHVEIEQTSPILPLDTALHWHVERTQDGFAMSANGLRYERRIQR